MISAFASAADSVDTAVAMTPIIWPSLYAVVNGTKASRGRAPPPPMTDICFSGSMTPMTVNVRLPMTTLLPTHSRSRRSLSRTSSVMTTTLARCRRSMTVNILPWMIARLGL